MCGTIVWLRRANDKAGNHLRDSSNPDAALRGRPLVGLPFLLNFKPTGRPERWTGGTIYDPDSGKSYSSKMEVAANGTLTVDGCVLFICRAQTWTRLP